MSVVNLIQNQPGYSSEIARENGKKGGLAAAESRRKAKLMRDVISSILPGEVTEPAIRERLESAGIEATHENAIAMAAILKAETGDIEAARYVRDTLGQKPTDKFNVDATSHSLEYLRPEDLQKLSEEELLRIIEEADEFGEDRMWYSDQIEAPK